MSNSQPPNPTSKHAASNVPDSKDTSQPLNASDANKKQQQPAVLEEDDEFEDFPVEDWAEEETQIPSGNAHLWEESWDDDDTNEDFAVQLREELKKLGK